MLADPLDVEPSRRVRALAFVALLACMGVPPCARQLLGVESDWLRPWRMYHGAAEGVVVAEFLERRPDGSEARIDRFARLGHPDPRAGPAQLWRIVGMRGTWEIARQLCEALGPGADVRVRSRVGTLEGWRPGYDGRENVCVLEAPEGKGRGGEP